MPTKYCLLFSLLLGAMPSPAASSALQQTVESRFLMGGDTRTFRIEYHATVPNVPPGTKQLRVWVPVPEDTTVQDIKELEFSSKPQLAREKKYGNRMACWEINDPAGSNALWMKFTCARRETRVGLSRLRTDGKERVQRWDVYLQPDQLVLVDDEIKRLSNQVTAGKTTTMEKARAIYNYVLEKMAYDKNHDGWGRGSTRHACDVGKGNCSDFHALFNSLCRAQGIPSGFEIGLYLPYERNSKDPLGGYHCWAFFRVPGKTWVPVDCSEADRFSERKEYFFANHTSNRVTLSTGRDLILEPPQSGPPLNFFIDPYAEADGKPIKGEKTWSYADLPE